MMAHLRNSAMYLPACRMSHTGVRSASARYTFSHSSAVLMNYYDTAGAVSTFSPSNSQQ